MNLLRGACGVLSLMLGLAVGACYAAGSDACAAVTIAPAWVWALPGLLLLLVGWERARPARSAAVLLAWLAFLAIFMDEGRSLLRGGGTRPGGSVLEWRAARGRGEGRRVVSLNCAGGSTAAAAEVAAWARTWRKARRTSS